MYSFINLLKNLINININYIILINIKKYTIFLFIICTSDNLLSYMYVL